MLKKCEPIRFVCPQCASLFPELDRGDGVTCLVCNAHYPITDGILSLLHPKSRELYKTLANKPIDLSGNKLPDEEQVLQANISYHETHAEAYEQDFSTKEIFTRETHKRVRDVIDLAKTQTRGEYWLDVGCGTGNVLALAADAFPCAKGMDLSLGMLKLAEQKGLDVVQGEAYHLPLPDDSVDVVSAFAVLHHLPNVTAFFKEAFRVLRPGGLFYSDYDPNRVSGRRNSFLWSMLRKFNNRIQRMGSGRTIDRDPHAKRIGELADYQMFFGDDFNGESQVQRLLDVGFLPANVIYHFNTPSIYYPSQASRMRHIRGLIRSPVAKWFDMRFMAEHFLLLANKPK